MQHPDREEEQPHHDGWHAGHHVAHEPDEPRQHALAAVLVEVDRAQDTERHGHDRRHTRDLERAEYRWPDSAHVRGRHLRHDRAGQEGPADDRCALGDHRVEDEHQRDDDDHERQPHQDGGDAVLGAPPARWLL